MSIKQYLDVLTWILLNENEHIYKYGINLIWLRRIFVLKVQADVLI